MANRLAIIDEHTDVRKWRHIPSSLNPADSASRGLEVDCLDTELWLKGPSFLMKPESDWPTSGVLTDEPPEEFLSSKRQPVHTTIVVETEETVVERLLSRCSCLSKLKRVTAWILRLISTLQHRTQHTVHPQANFPSVEELQRAEMVVIRHVQQQHFPYLPSHKSNTLPRFMQKLHPVCVDGVFRVGGRIGQTVLSTDVKHPIILPQRSHSTELVIRHHHVLVGHSGTSHTWTSIRQRYWIVKGGAAVMHSIGQCIKCKRRNATVGKQLMADIPHCRLQFDQPPFHDVGVDYFGPFLIRQGRSHIKRYGCVFTCLTMRAVHLEISHSLTADSFLNSLRRFIARRGKPAEIFSDNGTNFVGANRVLRESLQTLDQTRVTEYCTNLEIKWNFNPPHASHMGGAWERIIRSVRKILNALMVTQTLSDEGFLTLIAKVEAILNSRPLVPIIQDASSKEPLTPNRLLLLRNCPNLLPGQFRNEECYTRRRWAQVQHLSNQFWKRWLNEFLPNLQQRQKWFQPSKNLEVDDVVLLVDDLQQRSKWALGRVVKTLPDRRGLVRTVHVRTKNKVVTKPIAKLCLILDKTIC